MNNQARPNAQAEARSRRTVEIALRAQELQEAVQALNLEYLTNQRNAEYSTSAIERDIALANQETIRHRTNQHMEEYSRLHNEVAGMDTLVPLDENHAAWADQVDPQFHGENGGLENVNPLAPENEIN
jgi:hypothetical protein